MPVRLLRRRFTAADARLYTMLTDGAVLLEVVALRSRPGGHGCEAVKLIDAGADLPFARDEELMAAVWLDVVSAAGLEVVERAS